MLERCGSGSVSSSCKVCGRCWSALWLRHSRSCRVKERYRSVLWLWQQQLYGLGPLHEHPVALIAAVAVSGSVARALCGCSNSSSRGRCRSVPWLWQQQLQGFGILSRTDYSSSTLKATRGSGSSSCRICERCTTAAVVVFGSVAGASYSRIMQARQSTRGSEGPQNANMHVDICNRKCEITFIVRPVVSCRRRALDKLGQDYGPARAGSNNCKNFEKTSEERAFIAEADHYGCNRVRTG